MGNPVTASPDYPSLPHFGAEMNLIAKHFPRAARPSLPVRRPRPPPIWPAIRRSTPIFTLSRTPRPAARIRWIRQSFSPVPRLGQPTGENTFKLYAREIIEHPIDARMVTISACNGSGTRAYAGEGLVGLSWAFLRAGAHNVIGALWEVSDDSTPRLMDTLYQGLQAGQAPSAALRNAKLSLLRSQSRFSAPFYWAPFQIYTRR